MLLSLLTLIPAAWVIRGSGLKTRVLHRLFPDVTAWMSHPTIATVRPAAGAAGVPTDAFVACDVSMSNAGKVVDPATVNDGSVRLLKAATRQPVEAIVNTSAAGDVVVLQPKRPLEPNTRYTLQVLPALKDTGGASFQRFTASFTTAASDASGGFPAAFEKVQLPETAGHLYTGVTIGPDHKLYACTLHGRILRFVINSDGTVGRPETVLSPQTTGGEPRLITGICFDPAATAENPVLWVSHGQFALGDADDWTGKISRLSGPELETFRDVVVGLPRAIRDHLNNQMAFGPDGSLYVCQASNTAMGAPDAGWGLRPERLLSAAILRIDLKAALSGTKLPLDVRTGEASGSSDRPRAGGRYDPFAPGAPVTLYGRGLRNAFDLLWHSNGQLYAPVNGSSAGGNVPDFPCEDYTRAGLSDVRHTEPDVLVRVEPGGYYGHPVPARGESVLAGGNPTAGVDPFEVPQYPVGTPPERNWRLPAFDFGKHLAPCGLIEYKEPVGLPKGSPFGGALGGRILVTRYSGGKDIVVLTPGGPDAGYAITEAVTGVEGLTGFGDPLDLTEDVASGNLYVAEHAGERITLLRPKPGGRSTHVAIETPLKPVRPTLAPASPSPAGAAGGE